MASVSAEQPLLSGCGAAGAAGGAAPSSSQGPSSPPAEGPSLLPGGFPAAAAGGGERQAAEELLRSLAHVIRSWARDAPGAELPGWPRLSPMEGSDVFPGIGDGLLSPIAREYRLHCQTSDDHHFLGLGLGRGAADPSQRRLDEIERNADFWCNLVGISGAQPPQPRLGGVASATGWCLSDVRETILEEFFDLTPERVVEVFNSLARGADGRISAEALGEGLRVCGLAGLDATVPARILEAVAPGCDGRLQPAEFETILSRLKLAQLLVGQPSYAAPARRLTVVDYDPRGSRVDCCSDVRLREFFFGHRPPPRTLMAPGVRWVHLANLDLTLLLSLTVKYSLHPLAVEDVIEQCRTKVDRYGDHFFAAVEQLSLEGPCRGDSAVQVRGSHISIFCSGPPNLDTVITVSQPDRSFSEDWPGYASDTSGSAAAGSPYREINNDWVSRLRRRVEAPLSRLRERKAHFLLIQVFDICTDELVMVTYAYTTRLAHLEAELQAEGARLPSSWLDEMSLIRLQLAVVMRRARGMLRALRQLDDPDIREDLHGYLRDITDHLDEAFDDASILVEKCGAIISGYERTVERQQDKARQVAGDRLNNTLFALTVITTVLMPLQLMAGVYGMNFVDLDGTPTIPELLWPRGYLVFWMCALGYLFVSCLASAWLWKRIESKKKDDTVPETVMAAPLGVMGRTVGPPSARMSQRRTGI